MPLPRFLVDFEQELNMRTNNAILTLTLLILAASARAGDFDLNTLSAGDIEPPASSFLVPEPVAEISTMDQAEAAYYLSDRESIMETEEKSLPGEPAARNLGGDGTIKLYHQWHRETLEIRYRDANGGYIPEAMQKIKHLFRCRLTGREIDIPAKLIEILDIIQERQGGRLMTIICGYRSPELNGALASNSSGVAKKSLHLKGWAADIRIDGVRTSTLRDTAKSLKAGGVGYYASSGFVHVDIGRVRYW
ncbi:MAG: hypothetical protein COX65_03595 [Elusimicrobia bacterium CG_4_10_14_0_2_um_filter_56_8]|nr:MAG: hypothetical protein AUJ51_01640 [Elusimicrobia bacterium CG1_02_56_21]PJA15951.1 MAG: hypothetical protein COX65_03595 [Elusimicrobia bacterium CG_4_10_14_0_2_um_filter_56_8]